jgi:hypothetical protein
MEHDKCEDMLEFDNYLATMLDEALITEMRGANSSEHSSIVHALLDTSSRAVLDLLGIASEEDIRSSCKLFINRSVDSI